jgi:transmembrane 9 superfamily protein 2/4
VHWFSIVNSVLIVLFLSSMIAMILIRNVHRDISHYNRALTEEEKAEEREESGWKLVHADVFRPPATAPMLFCVFVGTGMQLFWMTLITVLFAAVGFLSPANRGSLMIAMMLLYVMMGGVAGFKAANLYKTFRGKQWQKCTLLTAFLYPGVSFCVFFTFNLVLWSYGSSGAVPILSMLAVVALWFGISVPLVFLGAYVGFRKEVEEYPTHPRSEKAQPRPIPDQPWYLGTAFTVVIGGILPFGACFVELFFILSSMWMDQYYYVFGFLLLVFAILCVTCAEITMVLVYFQLCSEDYHWWWRSFLTSGSTALYVFMYSTFYFSKLEANLAITYFLYFGYMSIICFGLFLMTGLVGYASSLWFTKKIYGSIKVD